MPDKFPPVPPSTPEHDPTKADPAKKAAYAAHIDEELRLQAQDNPPKAFASDVPLSTEQNTGDFVDKNFYSGPPKFDEHVGGKEVDPQAQVSGDPIAALESEIAAGKQIIADTEQTINEAQANGKVDEDRVKELFRGLSPLQREVEALEAQLAAKRSPTHKVQDSPLRPTHVEIPTSVSVSNTQEVVPPVETDNKAFDESLNRDPSKSAQEPIATPVEAEPVLDEEAIKRQETITQAAKTYLENGEKNSVKDLEERRAGFLRSAYKLAMLKKGLPLTDVQALERDAYKSDADFMAEHGVSDTSIEAVPPISDNVVSLDEARAKAAARSDAQFAELESDMKNKEALRIAKEAEEQVAQQARSNAIADEILAATAAEIEKKKASASKETSTTNTISLKDGIPTPSSGSKIDNLDPEEKSRMVFEALNGADKRKEADKALAEKREELRMKAEVKAREKEKLEKSISLGRLLEYVRNELARVSRSKNRKLQAIIQGVFSTLQYKYLKERGANFVPQAEIKELNRIIAQYEAQGGNLNEEEKAELNSFKRDLASLLAEFPTPIQGQDEDHEPSVVVTAGEPPIMRPGRGLPIIDAEIISTTNNKGAGPKVDGIRNRRNPKNTASVEVDPSLSQSQDTLSSPEKVVKERFISLRNEGYMAVKKLLLIPDLDEATMAELRSLKRSLLDLWQYNFAESTKEERDADMDMAQYLRDRVIQLEEEIKAEDQEDIESGVKPAPATAIPKEEFERMKDATRARLVEPTFAEPIDLDGTRETQPSKMDTLKGMTKEKMEALKEKANRMREKLPERMKGVFERAKKINVMQLIRDMGHKFEAMPRNEKILIGLGLGLTALASGSIVIAAGAGVWRIAASSATFVAAERMITKSYEKKGIERSTAKKAWNTAEAMIFAVLLGTYGTIQSYVDGVGVKAYDAAHAAENANLVKVETSSGFKPSMHDYVPTPSAPAAITPEATQISLPEYTVKPGDNLYKIIKETFPKVNSTQDIENLITHVRENPTAFGIESGDVNKIYPGDKIDVEKMFNYIGQEPVTGLHDGYGVTPEVPQEETLNNLQFPDRTPPVGPDRLNPVDDNIDTSDLRAMHQSVPPSSAALDTISKDELKTIALNYFDHPESVPASYENSELLNVARKDFTKTIDGLFGKHNWLLEINQQGIDTPEWAEARKTGVEAFMSQETNDKEWKKLHDYIKNMSTIVKPEQGETIDSFVKRAILAKNASSLEALGSSKFTTI